MAEVGHCISQAKHWIQSVSLAGSDFFSEVGCPGVSAQSYRDMGQTSMQRWFRVFPASSAALRVPRLCVRCVRLQLFGSSENQGLSAKTFTTSIAGKTGNIRFSTPLYYRVKLRDIASY